MQHVIPLVKYTSGNGVFSEGKHSEMQEHSIERLNSVENSLYISHQSAAGSLLAGGANAQPQGFKMYLQKKRCPIHFCFAQELTGQVTVLHGVDVRELQDGGGRRRMCGRPSPQGFYHTVVQSSDVKVSA